MSKKKKSKIDKEKLVKTLEVVCAAHEDADSKGLKRGSGGKGSMHCPTNCGGTLNYMVASVNGHMMAACTTKGCVKWME